MYTMNEFDEDVFEALIKKVVVGGVDENGDRNSHMLTYVFSEDRTNNGRKTNYIVIDIYDISMSLIRIVISG